MLSSNPSSGEANAASIDTIEEESDVRSRRNDLDSARETAKRKEVVLDKLGKARRLLDVIKAVGEAVSDVSICAIVFTLPPLIHMPTATSCHCCGILCLWLLD